jgi:hypothetical protein
MAAAPGGGGVIDPRLPITARAARVAGLVWYAMRADATGMPDLWRFVSGYMAKWPWGRAESSVVFAHLHADEADRLRAPRARRTHKRNRRGF